MPSITPPDDIPQKYKRNEEEVDRERRLDQLEAELTAVLKRYNARLEGCGCCGSPWLELDDEYTTVRDNVRLPRE